MTDRIKVNNEDCYESIMITLHEDKYPIAHKNKVDELMEQGAFDDREKAREWVNNTPIELEIYYEKDAGLFAVEAEAIDSCSESLCSPYTKALFDADFGIY
jgi:hypothetical protein